MPSAIPRRILRAGVAVVVRPSDHQVQTQQPNILDHRHQTVSGTQLAIDRRYRRPMATSPPESARTQRPIIAIVTSNRSGRRCMLDREMALREPWERKRHIAIGRQVRHHQIHRHQQHRPEHHQQRSLAEPVHQQSEQWRGEHREKGSKLFSTPACCRPIT